MCGDLRPARRQEERGRIANERARGRKSVAVRVGKWGREVSGDTVITRKSVPLWAMIDKLVLTCDRAPDYEYLDLNGVMGENESRKKFYNYYCELDRAFVQWKPHKFNQDLNDKFNFSRVELNPKYFRGLGELLSYLGSIYGAEGVPLSMDELHVTRIDLASDLVGVDMSAVMGSLNMRNVRLETFQIYKSTVYVGSDPKIVIYDKAEEIRERFRRGKWVLDSERELMESGDKVTRFEVRKMIKSGHLGEILGAISEYANYFDRCDLFSYGCEKPCRLIQTLTKAIPRKARLVYECLREGGIVERLKKQFLADVQQWIAAN